MYTVHCLSCLYTYTALILTPVNSAYLKTCFPTLKKTPRFVAVILLFYVSQILNFLLLAMAMSNIRYLATTTILGLTLSYGLHHYHGKEHIRVADCSVYKQGKGLDADGKPFEVGREFKYTSISSWIPP